MTNLAQDDPRDEAMQAAVRRTPRTFEVNELCGRAGEYEDDYINSRREYDRERRW
jgi:hypothetical protein